MPRWLRGELLRTCPAIFETGRWSAQHWFDGLGMVYAFRIGDSGIDFRSCMLDSEAARDAREGKVDLAAFGTTGTRSLLQRLLRPVPRASDNANVNIVRLGADLVALTESDRQHLIDRESLESNGIVGYERGDLDGALMTAHPHFDFERDRVVNAAFQFGSTATISIYEHAPAARRRKLVGSWKTPRVPYVHTFGLTPRHAVIVAPPFTAAPMDMLFSNKSYTDHFNWEPREGTRLVLIDRANGTTREHVADDLFVFHTVNAFERDGTTVLDLLAYSDAAIVNDLRVDRMAARLPNLRPSLVRLALSPGIERATMEPLCDLGFEFPATHYRAANGQAYRYAWGASNGPHTQRGYTSDLVKVDLLSGATRSFGLPTHVFGEPVFVARLDAKDEDDGVLLSVGAATQAESSMLAIVDARTMELLASAEVPNWIPLGFHGSFVGKEVARA